MDKAICAEATEAASLNDGMNPMTWLAESAEFGRSNVYTPEALLAIDAAARGGQKVETIDLSEEYLFAAGQVARKRAVFAAKRLGRILRQGS